MRCGGIFLTDREALQELSKINIKDMNNKFLRELTEVNLDGNTPIEERLESFLQQIENPYCFLVNGIPVQISFASHNKTLDDCLYSYLSHKKQSDNEN
jgi:hypothetical protein